MFGSESLDLDGHFFSDFQEEITLADFDQGRDQGLKDRSNSLIEALSGLDLESRSVEGSGSLHLGRLQGSLPSTCGSGGREVIVLFVDVHLSNGGLCLFKGTVHSIAGLSNDRVDLGKAFDIENAGEARLHATIESKAHGTLLVLFDQDGINHGFVADSAFATGALALLPKAFGGVTVALDWRKERALCEFSLGNKLSAAASLGSLCFDGPVSHGCQLGLGVPHEGAFSLGVGSVVRDEPDLDRVQDLVNVALFEGAIIGFDLHDNMLCRKGNPSFFEDGWKESAGRSRESLLLWDFLKFFLFLLLIQEVVFMVRLGKTEIDADTSDVLFVGGNVKGLDICYRLRADTVRDTSTCLHLRKSGHGGDIIEVVVGGYLLKGSTILVGKERVRCSIIEAPW